jgi:hypothetical protein
MGLEFLMPGSITFQCLMQVAKDAGVDDKETRKKIAGTLEVSLAKEAAYNNNRFVINADGASVIIDCLIIGANIDRELSTKLIETLRKRLKECDNHTASFLDHGHLQINSASELVYHI